MEITELDACKYFADAFNHLDPQDFIDHLASNVVYASELIDEPILGKEAISNYICGRIEVIREKKTYIAADFVKFFYDPDEIFVPGADRNSGDSSNAINWKKARAGIILNQQNLQEYLRLVVFQVEGEFIHRVEVSHPHAHKYIYFLNKDSPVFPLMGNA